MKPSGQKPRVSRRQIEAGAAAMGIELSQAAVEALATHLGAVLEKNREFNLTGVDDPNRAISAHILDSLSATAKLLAEPAGEVVDLGAGAGYPGIPLQIVTGRRVVLLESSMKKCGFLAGCVRELGLDAEVDCRRAEARALSNADEAGVVVARAVASLASLIELAAPLLREGGLLVAYKGAPGADELSDAAATAAVCGMSAPEASAVGVPGMDARRTLFASRKVGAPSVRLPRREGSAQKRPVR